MMFRLIGGRVDLRDLSLKAGIRSEVQVVLLCEVALLSGKSGCQVKLRLRSL